ncbi:hypothetical protein CLF_111206 [Clonorchis sinensis]|uniref:C2H2-type domain-containing protein n=1 Tax=Clonorchis sinensis TaxID=79923 RepID=G7YUH8_CLOSI|nr:hypothetical protein CLF_111206 [Clonorchis sinensis]
MNPAIARILRKSLIIRIRQRIPSPPTREAQSSYHEYAPFVNPHFENKDEEKYKRYQWPVSPQNNLRLLMTAPIMVTSYVERSGSLKDHSIDLYKDQMFRGIVKSPPSTETSNSVLVCAPFVAVSRKSMTDPRKNSVCKQQSETLDSGFDFTGTHKYYVSLVAPGFEHRHQTQKGVFYHYSTSARWRYLKCQVEKLRAQQLQTGLASLLGFNVLVTFNNVQYESSGASAPALTRTHVGLTCEECGKWCKSKAGLVTHHRVHDTESVDAKVLEAGALSSKTRGWLAKSRSSTIRLESDQANCRRGSRPYGPFNGQFVPRPGQAHIQDALRFNANALAGYLNLFLLSGVCPLHLCRVRITLVPKVPNPTSPDRLRPISVSSILVRRFPKVLADFRSRRLQLPSQQFVLQIETVVWKLNRCYMPCFVTLQRLLLNSALRLVISRKRLIRFRMTQSPDLPRRLEHRYQFHYMLADGFASSDDWIVCAKSQASIKERLEVVAVELGRDGMKTNVQKTKAIVICWDRKHRATAISVGPFCFTEELLTPLGPINTVTYFVILFTFKGKGVFNHRQQLFKLLDKSVFASIASSMFKRVRALCTEEVDRIAAQIEVKDELRGSGYPASLIRRQLRRVLVLVAQPKREWLGTAVIPYKPGTSEIIRRILNTTNTRDRLLANRTRDCVYKIKCNDCTKLYIGQTAKELHTRVGEHRRKINSPPRNAYKYQVLPKDSAIAEHALDTGHKIDLENVEVLRRGLRSTSQRLMAEAVEIAKHPSVNRIGVKLANLGTGRVLQLNEELTGYSQVVRFGRNCTGNMQAKMAEFLYPCSSTACRPQNRSNRRVDLFGFNSTAIVSKRILRVERGGLPRVIPTVVRSAKNWLALASVDKLGQPGSISALVLPSGGMAARHRKGVTAGSIDRHTRADFHYEASVAWTEQLSVTHEAIRVRTGAKLENCLTPATSYIPTKLSKTAALNLRSVTTALTAIRNSVIVLKSDMKAKSDDKARKKHIWLVDSEPMLNLRMTGSNFSCDRPFLVVRKVPEQIFALTWLEGTNRKSVMHICRLCVYKLPMEGLD